MILASLFLKSSNPFENIITAAIILTVFIITSVGFLIPVYQMPILIQKFTNSINFSRVHFESLLIILFKGRCESTPIVFNLYGINQSQLNSNLYHLIIEGIIFRIIALIIMLFQTNHYFISFFIMIKRIIK